VSGTPSSDFNNSSESYELFLGIPSLTLYHQHWSSHGFDFVLYLALLVFHILPGYLHVLRILPGPICLPYLTRSSLGCYLYIMICVRQLLCINSAIFYSLYEILVSATVEPKPGGLPTFSVVGGIGMVGEVRYIQWRSKIMHVTCFWGCEPGGI
jgi:hypothetical protein